MITLLISFFLYIGWALEEPCLESRPDYDNCLDARIIPISALNDPKIYGPYEEADKNVFMVQNGLSSEQLMIFLPGTSGVPPQYAKYMNYAGNSMGLPSIAIPYNWAGPVGYVDGQCGLLEGRENECWEAVHTLILEGRRMDDFKDYDKQYQKHIDKYLDDTDIYNEDQCVENRLRKVLKYLIMNDPNGPWSQFLKYGEPVWDKIIITGHSQGAVHAGWWAWKKKFARSVMWNGPAETKVTWPVDTEPKTPRDQIFGLAHKNEGQLPQMSAMWKLMKLPNGNQWISKNKPIDTAPAGGWHNQIIMDRQVTLKKNIPFWTTALDMLDMCRTNTRKQCKQVEGCKPFTNSCLNAGPPAIDTCPKPLKSSARCVFKSPSVPCYYWQEKDLVMEMSLQYLKTYELDDNDKWVDQGFRMLEKFHSAHEIVKAPNGDLVVTHMSTNSLIIVSGVTDALGGSVNPDDGDNFGAVRYVIPGDLGMHAVHFSKKDPNILFLCFEHIDTIAVMDYKKMEVVNRWEIPFKKWKMTANPDNPTMVTTVHTFVEDMHGNIYFTMKKPMYKMENGGQGMGAIGRLADPLDDSKRDDRWMNWKMSDLGKGVKTLPFYINIDVNGQFVWFNSIISAEMGVIDARHNNKPVARMFELPQVNDEGVITSRGEKDQFNSRPGGMIVMPNGDCYAAMYNKFGVIAKIEFETGDMKFINVPAVHGNEYAYLHISADFEMYEDKTTFKGEEFDLVLVASSNDFRADTITDDEDGSWSQPDQDDTVVLLRNFDPSDDTWEGMTEWRAPTQHSWFHRGWIYRDTPKGPSVIVTTEYYADRLFFVWTDAAADE